jgi:hypothetical protein
LRHAKAVKEDEEAMREQQKAIQIGSAMSKDEKAARLSREEQEFQRWAQERAEADEQAAEAEKKGKKLNVACPAERGRYENWGGRVGRFFR